MKGSFISWVFCKDAIVNSLREIWSIDALAAVDAENEIRAIRK